MSEGPLSAAKDGVRVRVRVSPRASREGLVGIAAAPGGPALRAAVTAPAEGGRANAALVALLAREWAVPRRDVAILAGHKSRDKLVAVAGDPAQLTARLGGLIAALAPG